MDNNPQVSSIKNSLSAMKEIFGGIDDYRVLGSLLVASINGQPHRELHDIDLLIDERVYAKVTSRFEEQGFTKITKSAPGFKWDEFSKPNYLTFGVLMRGRFTDSSFVYKPSRSITLSIKNAYLAPTLYELYGMPIRGIPRRSVYEGIKAASLNKKRRIDKAIVQKYLKENDHHGLSLNQAFSIMIFGTTVPGLYLFFSQAYNVLGGIRLLLGKPYDAWS